MNSEKHSLPGGSGGKASVYNAGELGSIPGLGRSPGEGIDTEELILLNCGAGEDS